MRGNESCATERGLRKASSGQEARKRQTVAVERLATYAGNAVTAIPLSSDTGNLLGLARCAKLTMESRGAWRLAGDVQGGRSEAVAA